MNNEKLSADKLPAMPDVAPSDLSPSRRAAQPGKAANEWERVLWSKTAPTFQRPLEEARPFGRSERTPTVLKWLRLIWARRWGARKTERIRGDIRETRNDMTAYLDMANYAINLAIKTEPLPEARNTKRRELMNRWRKAYERAFARSGRM